MSNAKWNRQFARDLGERMLSTFLYGLVTVLTTSKLTDLNGDVLTAILVVPVALCAIKCLLVNLGSEPDSPSASLVGVTSTTDS